MRDSNLERLVGKKGSIKSLVYATPCSPSSLTPFSVLHPGHLFLASGQYWRNCFWCFKGSLASLEALKHDNSVAADTKDLGLLSQFEVSISLKGIPSLQREWGDLLCPEEKRCIKESLLVDKLCDTNLMVSILGKSLGALVFRLQGFQGIHMLMRLLGRTCV